MIGGIHIGKLTSYGKRYDIRVRLAEVDRAHPKDIQKIWVCNDYGDEIPLKEVVASEIKPALFSITRKNRERVITIYTNPSQGYSQQDAPDEVFKIGKRVLSQDYRIVFSEGSQFDSFIHSFTVLLALPFSVRERLRRF